MSSNCEINKIEEIIKLLNKNCKYWVGGTHCVNNQYHFHIAFNFPFKTNLIDISDMFDIDDTQVSSCNMSVSTFISYVHDSDDFIELIGANFENNLTNKLNYMIVI